MSSCRHRRKPPVESAALKTSNLMWASAGCGSFAGDILAQEEDGPGPLEEEEGLEDRLQDDGQEAEAARETPAHKDDHSGRYGEDQLEEQVHEENAGVLHDQALQDPGRLAAAEARRELERRDEVAERDAGEGQQGQGEEEQQQDRQEGQGGGTSGGATKEDCNSDTWRCFSNTIYTSRFSVNIEISKIS